MMRPVALRCVNECLLLVWPKKLAVMFMMDVPLSNSGTTGKSLKYARNELDTLLVCS